jgi:peptidoglycan/xylan/chitin deacetylase (PgdA/CDA1 family)
VTRCNRLIGADALAPGLRALGRGRVSIFTLHRFADPDVGAAGHDPAMLREQLRYLRRHRYRLLSMSEVLEFLADGAERPTVPAVAFTVDDGYADFAHLAAPIFAEYDCPVTLFVPTGFLDGQLWLWWDRVTYLFKHTRCSSLVLELGAGPFPSSWATPGERARAQDDVLHLLEWLDAPVCVEAIASLAGQLEIELPTRPPPEFAPISWDDVRRLARFGVTFGPHTVTHRILSLAGDEDCDWEIRESYRRLRQQTDACVPVLCYPNGGERSFGLRECQVAHRVGVKAAVTTVPGHADRDCVRDRGSLRQFALPRFPAPADNAHLLHITTGVAHFRQMGWRRHPSV